MGNLKMVDGNKIIVKIDNAKVNYTRKKGGKIAYIKGDFTTHYNRCLEFVSDLKNAIQIKENEVVFNRNTVSLLESVIDTETNTDNKVALKHLLTSSKNILGINTGSSKEWNFNKISLS